MSKKKVAIIGAGPGGLFAAYKLADRFDVKVIDKGRGLEKRKCTVSSKGRCHKCNPCNILYGIGGAGLFSDGKLLFDTKIGNNLTELIGKRRNSKLVREVEKIFAEYGVHPTEENEEEINSLRKKAIQNEIYFVHAKQAHIGSDNLIALIKKVKEDLEKKGVKFSCNQNVKDLADLKYDSIVLAPGRGGSRWLEKILEENSINFGYRPVDVGVRIEVPKTITQHITDITRDMKFYMTTKKYGDRVRTFCTCPEGFIDQEAHQEFNLVNGHSDSQRKSDNTNFALLVTVLLTKPQSNTNAYAKNIAQVFDGLGGGKPILQRLGDLKKGRRSKQRDNWKYALKPTLENVTYGDISLAMPSRYLENLLEVIDRLNKIIPGLTNDATILYAPEMKFHGLKIKTDKYLQASKGLYVAGDGAGVSRGIVGAACSGLLAAKGILR